MPESPISVEDYAQTTLVTRNVVVQGRRTSVRLEPEMWDAFAEICRREGRTVHDICSDIDFRRTASTLTAAIRVYLMDYFRQAATEEGHLTAGHGGRTGLVELPLVPDYRRGVMVRLGGNRPNGKTMAPGRAHSPS